MQDAADTAIGSKWMARLLPVLVVVLAGAHFYCPPARVGELEVVPDSVEYAVAGHRFATTGRYEIVVNGQALPPRYPPGFSVLFLAPVYAIAPGEIGNGIFAVWVCGILAALFAYLIGNRLAGPWGGLLAAGLLLHHPQFADYTQVIMTDVPATALALMACWLYLRVRSSRTTRGYLLAGCVVALSVSIRPLTGLLMLPFLADIACNRRPGIWRRLMAIGLPSVVVVVGTSLQQWHAFGDWRRTGYQFWLPVPYDYFSLVFSPRYFRDNLHLLQWVFIWCPVFLGAIGIYILSRRRAADIANAVFFLLVGILPLSVIHLFYFFTDIRFHFPSLAMFCVFAGAGIGALIPKARGKSGSARRTYDNASRIQQTIRRSTHLALPILALTILIPSLRKNPLEEGAPIRREVATVADSSIPADAVLISSVDPAYLEQCVARGTARRMLPIDRATPYASEMLAPVRIAHLDPAPRNAADHACLGLVNGGARRLFPFTADENISQLTQWVRDGVPVYLELLSTTADRPSRLALQQAFQFVPVSPQTPWLVRLRPLQEDPRLDHNKSQRETTISTN